MLLVDDHELLVESLRRALAGAPGIDVVAVAATAAEALALADEHGPDVVLMDYRLPDDTGAAAAARVLERRPDTKIVLLTGVDDPELIRAAVEAGCVGYLEKSVSLDRLVQSVRAVADGEVVLSPDELARVARPRAQTGGSVSQLTPRELDVLDLLAEGLSNKAIAERLFLSVNTVRTHVQAVLMKLGAHSKLEAVAIATREGHFPRRG